MAGEPVALIVTGASADVTDYRWDLTGRGAYSLDSGPAAQITTVFASPGPRRVGVQLHSATAVEQVSVVVSVTSKQHRGHDGAKLIGGQSPHKVAPDPWPSSTTGTRVDSTARTQHRTGGRRPAAISHAGADAPPRPAVHRTRALSAEADPGVTIADFHFAPGTTTIHVGDTVTWSNSGPSPHSATARNGTFNTGILHKGQSGSHTFTQAGTFSYFCTVHPFMHGTIVVLASSTSHTSGSTTSPASSSTTQSGSGSTSTPSASTPTSPPTDQPAQAQTLPMTGINLSAVVVTGLVLVGLGLGLRRATSSR